MASDNKKKKFFIVTTIPGSLDFFKGQLRLLNDNFQVSAISSQNDRLKQFGAEEGIPTIHIPMERPVSLWKDPISLMRFIALFAATRPHIVHGNTPKGSFLSMIAAWLTRVPVRIYMCHGLRYQGYQGGMRRLLMAMERISCRCATRVIAVSHGTKNTLLNDSICPPEKLTIVGDGSAGGIDLTLFNRDKIAPAKEITELIPAGDFKFCFVGRIVKDKGINEMIEAFSHLCDERGDISLVMVGPFEDAENPIDHATRETLRNHPKIHLFGSKSDVKPYIVACDMLLLPSYREGLPTVPIEAGALSVPTIATDIPGCNEVVINGKNGYLVKPRDPKSLFEAMKLAVDSRDSAIIKMGQTAREMVEAKYEQKKVWSAYRKLYNSLAYPHQPHSKTDELTPDREH